jgi:putative FmdB family regulatory protein
MGVTEVFRPLLEYECCMPLYEYKCDSCGKIFEVIQKFADEPLTAHPECGGKVERLLSAPAFHLKGTGWYATDYAKSNGKSKENKDSKSDDSKSAKSGDSESKTESTKKSETSSSGDSKPAASSDTKPAASPTSNPT